MTSTLPPLDRPIDFAKTAPGALAESGHRVLCIDMDPQANLTAGLGINLNTVERSMADVLADGRSSLREVVLETEDGRTWPRSRRLSATTWKPVVRSPFPIRCCH